MQDDFPLTLTHLRRRIASVNADREIVSVVEPGVVERCTYSELAGRTDRLAGALQDLGLHRGDRVASLAWNTRAHLELYVAAPCLGIVLHTVNARMAPEQIAFTIREAADRVVFVDHSLAGLVSRLREELPSVEHWVVLGGGGDELPDAEAYEELIENARAVDAYPELDERDAAFLCYTSGTTGDPKGVLYSHRSVMLHALGCLGVDSLAISVRGRVLIVVPMFHVNAWGLPFAAMLAGAGVLLPGRHLGGEQLAGLIAAERATVMAAVPTVYSDLLAYAEENRPDLSSLTNCIAGGARVPLSLIERFEGLGVPVVHAWGMTETSPVCTVSRALEVEREEPGFSGRRAKQGRILPFVEMRLLTEDGGEAPWDGAAAGEIAVRGPWIASQYFGVAESGSQRFEDGWLRTGDVGTIDPDGYMEITDRTKDMIKSGGEWISSMQLERELLEDPTVGEVAVIPRPDERWGERPLPCVVLAPGASLEVAAVLDRLEGRVPRWWVPEELAVVAEMPLTSTGKYDKKALKRALAEGRLSDIRGGGS